MSLPQSTNRRQLLQARARFMRHNPTYSEMLLWSAIRGKRLGVQFRRQQVIGNHIVDFFCRPAALVVEVDGDVYHAQHVALATCLRIVVAIIDRRSLSLSQAE